MHGRLIVIDKITEDLMIAIKGQDDMWAVSPYNGGPTQHIHVEFLLDHYLIDADHIARRRDPSSFTRRRPAFITPTLEIGVSA